MTERARTPARRRAGEPGERPPATPTSRRAARWARAAAVLPLVLLAAFRPARSGQEKRYRVAEYDVEVAVEEDGSYRVRERIVFDFAGGDFSRARRAVPLSRVDSITGLEVESPTLAARGVAAGRSGGRLRVRWRFGPTRGRVPFVLGYRAHGAIQESGGRNVVHWAAVGDDWDVPIDSVRVAVTLPARFAGARDSLSVEPAADAHVETGADRWTVRFAHGGLDPATTYAVRVTFPRVIAGRTGRERDGRIFLLTVLSILVGMAPGLYLTWRWTGPEADAAPVPPGSGGPDLPPALGVLLAEAESLGSQGGRLFAAMITDLARRGHLRLERYEEDALLGTRRRVRPRLLGGSDPGSGGEALADGAVGAVERDLLERLARHDSLRAFRKEEGEFRERVRERLIRELADRGLLESQEGRSRRVRRAAAGAGAAAAAAFVAGAVTGAAPVWELGGLLAGGASGLLIASGRTHQLTERGARVRATIHAHLDRWTERISEAAEGDSAARTEAARLLVERLPWLLLEGRFAAGAAGDLQDELEDESDLLSPSWVRDLTGDDDWTAAHAAAGAAAASSVSTSAAAAGAAGAGAAGAAGGGGGGAA